MTSCDKQVINCNEPFEFVLFLMYGTSEVRTKERESMCCRHKKLQVYFIS